MILSIFPKAAALPSTKEEKAYNSRFVSKPFRPENKEFNTQEELIEIITNYTWSPFVFKDYRRQDDFISTDVIAFDIDCGQTIEQAEEIVHILDTACLCIPSTSFTPEDHRFRLIFPLAKTITNAAIYRATYGKLAENFNVDPACKDLARFYFGGKLVDGFWFEGSTLLIPTVPEKPKNIVLKRYESKEVVSVGETIEELVEALYGEKRDKIPDCVAHFLENAPDDLSGQWYHSSNSFLFTCGLMGLEQHRIEEVFFSLYPYDELTPKVVDKMINDGYNSRDEM